MCRSVLLVTFLFGCSQAISIDLGNLNQLASSLSNNADSITQAFTGALGDIGETSDVAKRAIEGIAENANCPAPTLARALHSLLMKKVRGVMNMSQNPCRDLMKEKFVQAQSTCLPALWMAVKGIDEDDDEEKEEANIAAGGLINEERLNLLMSGVRMFNTVCKQIFQNLRDQLEANNCQKETALVNMILFIPHKVMGFYFHKKMALEYGYGKMNEYLEEAKDELRPGHPCRNWMDANNATFIENCPIVGAGWEKHIEFADKLRAHQDQCVGSESLPPQ